MRALRPLLASLAVLALVTAPPARADGDPASDVLLGQDVFTPYAPNAVSPPVEGALKETVERARAVGFEVKVALIADERDLGSVAKLYGDPQGYANLLTQELSLDAVHGPGFKAPRVLTVLPGGLGGNNLGDGAGDALAGLLPAEDEGADGLARTAALAIDRLARAEGKPIALPDIPGASSGDEGGGGSVPAVVVFGAPALLVALVIGGLALRTREDEEGAGEPTAPEPAPVGPA